MIGRRILSLLPDGIYETRECNHCGLPIRNFLDAIQHHRDAHEDKQFEASDYLDMDEWRKADPEELPEEVRDDFDI